VAQPLKLLYSPAYVTELAATLGEIEPTVDRTAFVRDVFGRGWNKLELKQRVRRISTTFGSHLPGDYPQQVATLRRIAPHFDGFRGIMFPDFVEVHGLEHFEESIDALADLTRHSSSEFAVRPFIVRYGQRMLDVMHEWSRDPDEHVRRLASEGCRPRLPWGIALGSLKKDPTPILPILDRLRADSSEYVRRSVANNLNDIVKDHPDLVLEIAERWLGTSVETDKLVKHACRTLLKRGDQRALKLFGEHDTGNVAVSRLTLGAKSVAIGDVLDFWFAVSASASGRARIEYTIDFVNKSGGKSKKVFKVADRQLTANEQIRIERRHPFTDFTTRRHYPGRHELAIVVNGVVRAKRTFDVTERAKRALPDKRAR
jgi:3-methyladenine DNA glycosylase AlkC